MKYLYQTIGLLLLLIYSDSLKAQAQMSVEMDSDSNNPHISVMETESGDFSRFWFQHALAPNNKWAINARTQNGTTSNDGQLIQPFVLAFNGVQKLGLSSDGKLRINNQYVLPTIDGTADQVLATDGAGTLNWSDIDDGYWVQTNDKLSHNGLVEINPTALSTFQEPAFETRVNRANIIPMISIRNTNALGDATVFMNASAKYWSYGVDSDINAFKINHVGNGIATTLDDGNKRFAILGDSGYIGFGTDSPTTNLDLADNGANIRFSDGNNSALEWYESGVQQAYLIKDSGSIEMKAVASNHDIILDATRSVVLKYDGTTGLEVDNEEVSIESVLRLKPRVVPPTCDDGRLYYSSLSNKVLVCSGGLWKALQFE